ncbi:MAG: phospholipid transport system substrate-binding protein [Paraglaciecola sp.]|jgi:phospholipid transport system substrate-binding protein
MKKIFFIVLFLSLSGLASGAPSETAKLAISEILQIASDKTLAAELRKEQLDAVIKKYVDLPATSQRVVATFWPKASNEDKAAFVLVFRKVLTDTYFNLLQNYKNEEVTFGKEEIKKQRYASVESIVLSEGKEIPVTYLLIFRNDEWRLYDFVVEGISLVRTFSNDYQGILRKAGLAGLNIKLQETLDKASP